MKARADEGSERRLADLTSRGAELLNVDVAQARLASLSGIELATQLADVRSLASNLFVHGSCHIQSGAYAPAEEELRRALDLAQEAGDLHLKVRILRALLKCAFYTRETDAALVRGMQALHLVKEVGDRAMEAQVHTDLGIIFGNLGAFEDALEHLLTGLRILREEGSTRLASHLNNIGNVYLELSEYREALGFFSSAREEFHREQAWRGEAIARGNIGRAHIGLGSPEEAVDAYRQSLLLLEEHGDTTYRPSAAARLGTALAEVGQIADARRSFASALGLLSRSPHREFADEVLTAIGLFHLHRGESRRAIAWLKRALAVLPDDEMTKRVYELHRALSTAYERSGELPGALHHFKEYHRVRQSTSDRSTTVRIRGTMFQFDVEQARQREEIYRLRNIELATANEELQVLHAALESQNSELHRLSVEDSLTGLYNRRHLDYQLSVEISRAKRYHRPMCAVLCDIDHFKSINDRYSHGVGDEVLRRVAIVLRQTARVTDVVGRYGGEEFLLLLPDTDLAGGVRLGERLRVGLATHPWHEVDDTLTVTFSIGVSLLSADGDALSLLAHADSNLYEAKRRGRDQVVS